MEKIKYLFTERDVCRSMYDTSVESNCDCIAILKPEALHPIHRTPDNQLVRLHSGFGCYPDRLGNACYSTLCRDGSKGRWEKTDFLGIANEKVTKYAEWLETQQGGPNNVKN